MDINPDFSFNLDADEIVQAASESVIGIIEEADFVREADIERHVESVLDGCSFVTESGVDDAVKEALQDAGLVSEDRVEEMIDVTCDAREYIDASRAEDIARDVVDSRALDEDQVARMIENAASRDFASDEAEGWALGQLLSLPRDFAGRCRLGQAFTTAVLHVLNDVIAETHPQAQDAMAKLRRNLAPEAAPFVAAMGVSDGVVTTYATVEDGIAAVASGEAIIAAVDAPPRYLDGELKCVVATSMGGQPQRAYGPFLDDAEAGQWLSMSGLRGVIVDYHVREVPAV